MRDFAFISRHEPTESQHALALRQDIHLVPVGDADAFSVENDFLRQIESDYGVKFDGVIVVHPAAAMRLCKEFAVGVFKNANRTPAGEKPQFVAKSLHIYDVREKSQ